MRNLKRNFVLVLALAITLFLALPGFAAEAGYTDVVLEAPYAEAAAWCYEQGLMRGTSATTFDPDLPLNRAMAATILYRAEKEPQTAWTDAFADVPAGQWYSDAIIWANTNRIVLGYDTGLYGPFDLITREQLAAILWRYDGEKVLDHVQISDWDRVSVYAQTAVDWAVGTGVMARRANNSFGPTEYATRAETAMALYNYLGKNIGTGGKTLVVYYSATGSTERVAGYIAGALNADTFELVPVEPYSSTDLDWTTAGSRVNREHDNENLREVKLTSNTAPNWADYDTVFVGYPIWWGIAAWPVNAFIQNNDFTGKTVIPFCTSASSGLGQSGTLLAEMAGTGNWQEGRRFFSGASQNEVSSWANSLNLPANTPDTNTPAASSTRILVAYFSMPETANPNNMTTEEDNSVVVINGQVLGNTQYMAQVIQESTGGDIFRIEPVIPYPTDHSTLVSLASQEQSDNARPAIQGQLDMDDYDVIFVGYPIWWSDLPMIMYTFFDQYDLSGKTIIPFSTHGGSNFAGTPATIQRLEPNARMLDGLTISRNSIQNARQQIVDWVNGLALN